MERGHLLVERGRLALADGAHKEARDLLDQCSRPSNSQVQVATCHRLLGNVAAEEGRYRQAERLLEEAREAFERANDKPEIDEVWDDIARSTY
ncbi:MAG: hypothetical protein QOE93_122 [Actinomycetota bacterium]|jgi:tetratricopeptide (TPR) repeat protein|nr:hypothetical protein [Actinomycetota bacterium]